jgi:putative phosphoesterase
MKLAVIADIHSNLPALQAVTDHLEKWQPDRVIVAGDIVNRGPRPVECLQFVQDKQRINDWQVVIGNHEEYVIHHSLPDSPRKGPRFQIYQTSFWTYQQLKNDVSALKAMPNHSEHFTTAGLIHVTHASMRGTRDGILPKVTDDHLRLQIDPQAAVFCVGHTHLPLIRSIDQTLVVNCGSVGLPFDGDGRAAYAQIERVDQQWRARIVRLDYDRAQADRDYDETSFMQDSGAFAPLIRSELRLARSALMEWSIGFEQVVMHGEISIEESVRRFLLRQSN